MKERSTAPICPVCQVVHDVAHQAELEKVNLELRKAEDTGKKKNLEKRIKNLKPKSTSLTLVMEMREGCTKKHNLFWVCPVRPKVQIGGKDDPREHYEEPHWREQHR